MTDTRIPVPDPPLMRRAARRMTVALVVVLALTTIVTVAGFTLLATGQLPGLPLAAGGLILQLALIVLVVVTLRVRYTLDGNTISRAALADARRITVGVRRLALTTIAALLVYALIRLGFGDPWSLLTAVLIGIALWFLAAGAKRIRQAHDRSLAPTS